MSRLVMDCDSKERHLIRQTVHNNDGSRGATAVTNQDGKIFPHTIRKGLASLIVALILVVGY
jgi:hypothetical protein